MPETGCIHSLFSVAIAKSEGPLKSMSGNMSLTAKPSSVVEDHQARPGQPHICTTASSKTLTSIVVTVADSVYTETISTIDASLKSDLCDVY